MWLTEAKATNRLRAETGLNWEWCRSNAKRLATKPHGKRKLVSKQLLDILIAEENKVPETQDIGIKGISKRKRERLQERCI